MIGARGQSAVVQVEIPLSPVLLEKGVVRTEGERIEVAVVFGRDHGVERHVETQLIGQITNLK